MQTVLKTEFGEVTLPHICPMLGVDNPRATHLLCVETESGVDFWWTDNLLISVRSLRTYYRKSIKIWQTTCPIRIVL